MKINNTFVWMVVGCISFIVAVRTTQAVPLYPSDFENSRPVVEVEDPEVALEILTRLGQSILRAKHEAAASNSKRGLDLGLGRGFSGSQAAKHIMGLAAAKFSNGPGKRKRTEIALDYPSNPGMDVPPVSMNSGNDW